MKKVFYIIFPFLMIEFNHSLFAQTREINFYNLVTKVRTIKPDEKILIGSINSLDIDKNGNILITDRVANQVYLLDPNGKLIRTLLPDSCHPGFNWRPFDAKFDKSGNILVLNANPWGYRFYKNGKCLGKMDIKFLAPLHISFLSDSSIVGYYNDLERPHLKMMDNLGREKFKFGRFPDEFKRIIYRLEGGGLITDKDDNIYQLNVISPEIFKYNKHGKLLKSFYKNPSYYQNIERDFLNDNPANVLSEVPKLLKDKTLALSLFLFNDDKLLIQFMQGNYYIIQICSLDGKYMKDEISIDKQILLAKHGLIYLTYQPEPDKKGNLPNPIIEVYKLK
ncbi:MAG: hypothetical protein ACUVRG_02025 [Ignavibacterium sp.]|uniref:hypothetical protein n=1 Tax=Ignavibacterium sp. TaxID=2651167 RepID=UPI0040496404